MNKKIKISDKEFLLLKELIHKNSGIDIQKNDKIHLENKLYDIIIEKNITSFRDYYNHIKDNSKDIQVMINEVTINETYFFREKKHFSFLKEVILPTIKYDKFRCWSAAGSNGAEAYSIAMEIDYNLNSYKNWEILTSDINNNMIEYSKNGVYPIKYSKRIPLEYLKKYCSKGIKEDEGFFKFKDNIKKNILYEHINLINQINTKIGIFDIIFLRNMIIYVNDNDKKTIINNILKHLKKDGYLFMGHSESLNRITDKVVQIEPSIYKKL
ncbi:MAG: protein-glutamate O-methyltransferase CheR [Campylobacterota bacterium]|nr:protein-glutamate O-methyltransferase CheR [Campylobacterota bacterium]